MKTIRKYSLNLIMQLRQLRVITHDGDVMSKGLRDTLENMGYVGRHNGYNFLTTKGIDVLIDFAFMLNGDNELKQEDSNE